MFERYTEKARRVIFFARYEAAQLAATAIEDDHILLGILREDKAITQLLLEDADSDLQTIRMEVEQRSGTGIRVHASADMPLSPSAKRVLSRAADESDRLNDNHIGTEHLLVGLIKEEGSVTSQILHARSIAADELIAQFFKRRRGEAALHTHPESQHFPLSERLKALVDRLAHKGVFRREQFNEQLATHFPDTITAFNLLLDLLVSKGVLSEEEKREISSGQSGSA